MNVNVRNLSRWAQQNWSRRPSRSARSGEKPRVLLAHVLDKAEKTPDRVALTCDSGESHTYAELAAEALDLCSGLSQLGLTQGDVISMQLPNWREAVVINIAASGMGLIINPIPPIYRGAELKTILADAGSRVIFIPERFRSIDYAQMLSSLRPELPGLCDVVMVRGDSAQFPSYRSLIEAGRGSKWSPREVDPDSIKLVLYTSGTTGRPKGVLHSHAAMQIWPMVSMAEWELGDGDVMFMPSPVTHVTGYAFGLELPFISDVRVALTDQWHPHEAIAYINRVQASACVGATPFLKELIDEAERLGDRLDSMRIFACGGASVPPELLYRVRRLTNRCSAFRVYGASEVPLVTQGFPKAEDLGLAAETDGRVVGYEVKIVDQGKKALGPDKVGEILVRGPSMMLGYTSSEETENAIDEDGFFQTGDLGYLNGEGGLVVTGRKKDIIIRGGENLSPKEIEDALSKHPDIQETAVVAMPHPRLGEGVCVYVRTREGGEAPSLMDITQFLEEQGLARQKFPERIEYVTDFPRTPSGKIRKDLLRNALKTPPMIHLDRGGGSG